MTAALLGVQDNAGLSVVSDLTVGCRELLIGLGCITILAACKPLETRTGRQKGYQELVGKPIGADSGWRALRIGIQSAYLSVPEVHRPGYWPLGENQFWRDKGRTLQRIRGRIEDCAFENQIAANSSCAEVDLAVNDRFVNDPGDMAVYRDGRREQRYAARIGQACPMEADEPADVSPSQDHLSLAAEAVPAEHLALLVPGTDPSSDPAHPNTFPLLGVHVHGNLFFSACMMVLSLLGTVLLITG